jgi:uncharacterized SAM-binding protein YcdF (DUF218 family)
VFFASKILVLLTQPLAWVALLLVLAFFQFPRKPLRARKFLGGALVVLLLTGWLPLPDTIIRHLENQYPEVALGQALSDFEGAIILGGSQETADISQAHSHPQLNSSAERLTVAVSLAQRHPALKLVFTGGEGALVASGPTEAQRSKVFFDSMGIAANRVQYESTSRNTHENATLTRQLAGVDPHKRWLLITSAWHMPRSLATFQKQGWNVTAYPVDYRTADQTAWTDYSMKQGAERWQLALHELVGIAAYRVTGRL